MLHPWIRGRIWAYGVPNEYARFDAVVLQSHCYRYVSYAHMRPWEANKWVYRLLSFVVMRGVAEHLICR